MSDLDLTELRRMMEAATPGPWSIDSYVIEPGDTPGQWHIFEALEDDPPIATFNNFRPEDDARLTLAMRCALPELLDRAERLARLECNLQELVRLVWTSTTPGDGRTDKLARMAECLLKEFPAAPASPSQCRHERELAETRAVLEDYQAENMIRSDRPNF